jgi:hypothetical protein
MRGRLLGLLLVAAAIWPAGAAAAPVLVMHRDGRVQRRNDPFLAIASPTPAPAHPRRAPSRSARPRAVAARAPGRKRRVKPRTVPSELTRLYRAGQLDFTDYGRYRASWAAAGAAARRLRGPRAVELKAVIANLQGMAAARALTPSRLPALFLTLDRNRQWWTTGPLLSSGQRVEFAGSNLVWEYYPGQGIELQVLATFGKADGLYTAGPADYSQLRALLDEMIPLAARRAGGLAWEYYFHFDGGSPPWVSAMAQGTGLEALSRAAQAFGATSGPSGSTETYLQIAQQALPLFTVAPPAGVRVATPAGARYLQYSFAPGTDIINAFLQSLIGLYDYARLSASPQASQLFAAGNAQAQAELPRFDTGAWSLYQPGVEDDLSYHQLVTGFLDQLCQRVGARVYCATAQHFHAYLKTPPTVRLLTTVATGKRRFSLRFALSKYSHVGIVITRGQHTALSTSAYFGYGLDAFAIPALHPGSYQVVLAATDLPGNFTRIVGSLRVSRPRRST